MLTAIVEASEALKFGFGKFRKIIKHFHNPFLMGVGNIHKEALQEIAAAKAFICEGYIVNGLGMDNKKEQKILMNTQWEELSAEQVDVQMVQPALYQELVSFVGKSQAKRGTK